MVNYDVIVIGAGYWGTASTIELRKTGKKVLQIDSNDSMSGSRAASGICDPRAYDSNTFKRYWPSDWSKSDLTESLSWLLNHKGFKVTEYFWNQFQYREVRESIECIYVPTPESFTSLTSPLKGIVVSGTVEKKITVHLADSREYTSNYLVVAAGYKSDEVLKSFSLHELGVTQLYGRGLNVKGTPKVSTPVSVMIGPYVKHTVRSWSNGLYKVGDTAEKNIKDSNLENLRKVGQAVLKNYEEVKMTEGYRPVLDQFTVTKVSPRVVVATGGQRLSLGLCGLVGRKVVECLK